MRINEDDSNLHTVIFTPRYRGNAVDGKTSEWIQIFGVLSRDKGRERESMRVITQKNAGEQIITSFSSSSFTSNFVHRLIVMIL